jgi:hypothetical protein
MRVDASSSCTSREDAAACLVGKAGSPGLTAVHSAITFWWSAVEPGGRVVGKVGVPAFGSEV